MSGEKYKIYKLYNSDKKEAILKILSRLLLNLHEDNKKHIFQMIQHQNTDEKILNYAKNSLHDKPPDNDKIMQSEKRSLRISNIVYQFWKKSKKHKIADYLDIGCNNGLISVKFGNLLSLQPDNIYGVDIKNFTNQKIVPVSGFHFKYYDGSKIPYPDENFDLVSFFMVLHHIPNLEFSLEEAHRVLKRGGYLLIKEHDAKNLETEWLITLEHIIYDIVDYHIDYQDFFSDYYQKLYSKDKMETIIQNKGFELISMADPFFVKKFHRNNETCVYYTVYKKIEI